MQNLNNIIPELVSIISTKWKRFKQPDRILVASEIESSNLGYDDLIVLSVQGSESTLLSRGKLEAYRIKLTYLKKIYRDKSKEVSAFYEQLDLLLTENSTGTNYYSLETSVDFEGMIELPEDTPFDGFVINLEIKAGKF